MALVRVSSDKQPIQGGGETGSRQVIDALQLPRLSRRLQVQVFSAQLSSRGPGPELHAGQDRQQCPGEGRGPGGYKGAHGAICGATTEQSAGSLLSVCLKGICCVSAGTNGTAHVLVCCQPITFLFHPFSLQDT